MRRLVVPLVLLLVGGCGDDKNRITLIAVTDFHGALDEEEGLGGAERFAGAIQSIRANSGSVPFLIDAGDLFSGTMISNTNEGAPVIELYNRLGVDAAAVGNHEFDYGPVGEASVATVLNMDPRGAIRTRAEEATFPFLAANIDSDDDDVGAPWYRPSTIISREGIRVGVVGATSMSTPFTTIADNLLGLSFASTAERVAAEAKRLRTEGVNFVVLTIHDGGICANEAPIEYPLGEPELAALCEETEIFEILRQIPDGTFDAVVAGHTHRSVIGTFGGVAILQAPAKGKGVAWAELKRRETELEVSVKDIVRVDATVIPDRDVTALLAPYRQAIETRQKEKLGVNVKAELTRDFHVENALGNFMADMLRNATGASVAVLNNGGLRTNLPAGMITYGRVYNILPFDNRVATVTVTGENLADAVALGLSGEFEGYSWSNLTQDEKGIRIGGEPIELKETYVVAYSDFLASGGSGFASLEWPKAEVWNDKPPMRDLIVAAIKDLAIQKAEIIASEFFDAARPRLRR
jgi:5'-nucleotidase